MKLASPVLTASIVLGSVGNDSGDSYEVTLQLVGRLLWRTDQETDTVASESMDESSG